MPKVRDSSGTIGTTRLPKILSRITILSSRTKAIVVDISRPSLVASKSGAKVSKAGTGKLSALERRCGKYPPSSLRRARMYSNSGLPSANFTSGISSSCSSLTGISKRSRNRRTSSGFIFLAWWAIFIPSPEPPMP